MPAEVIVALYQTSADRVGLVGYGRLPKVTLEVNEDESLSVVLARAGDSFGVTEWQVPKAVWSIAF